MRRSAPSELLLLLLLFALPSASQDGGRPVVGELVLTGSLRATDSEMLVTPASSTWQVSLQWLIEEGSPVEPGDPVARFDPGSTQSELHNKEDQLEEKRQERESQQAQASLRRMELELALKRAEVEYKKAQIDASIPQDVLEGKDYRERQLKLKPPQEVSQLDSVGCPLKKYDACHGKDAEERGKPDGPLFDGSVAALVDQISRRSCGRAGPYPDGNRGHSHV